MFPGTVALTLSCLGLSQPSPTGVVGGRDGVREGEEEGFIKENRLEKDSPTYSHSVAL